MAVREEDLLVREAIVYRFPSAPIRARLVRRAMLVRRRRTFGALSLASAVWVLASLPTV
ncbi:MAG: hypothetical protein LC808_28225 [Actinobacteria bacterium]|nr:hypothetical protein [Actinomycetota bacterium]